MTGSELPVFHARAGWTFARAADGSVVVTAPPSGASPFATSVTLDRDTWASVVASVSAPGETGPRWRAALAFHAGREGYVAGAPVRDAPTESP